jgi:5-methylcytosine-specific restriction endonuclease McrA
MRKVGLGWVCDEECLELVRQRARVKHASRVRQREAKPYRAAPTDLRKRVRRRDGERCRWCGAARRLEVHHIVYASQGGKNVMDNLITLCTRHHAEAHSNKTLWAPVLTEAVRLTEAGTFLTVPEVAARMRSAS